VVTHIYVDESCRHERYIVAAAFVADAMKALVERELRRRLLPGQRRLHFAKEQQRRRRELAGVLAELPVTTRIYTGKGDPAAVRAECLRRLVADAAGTPARLVLERRDPAGDRADLAIIAAAVRNASLRYGHLAPQAVPGLWIADAAAWSYGAGGEWAARLDGLLAATIDVGAYP
jgi:hypothetical protein